MINFCVEIALFESSTRTKYIPSDKFSELRTCSFPENSVSKTHCPIEEYIFNFVFSSPFKSNFIVVEFAAV